MKRLLPIITLAPTSTLATFAAAAATPPNFIVLLADDQGWGTTSVMIDPMVPELKTNFFKTPNIERQVASGMRCSQGYASHCNCSPNAED